MVPTFKFRIQYIAFLGRTAKYRVTRETKACVDTTCYNGIHTFFNAVQYYRFVNRQNVSSIGIPNRSTNNTGKLIDKPISYIDSTRSALCRAGTASTTYIGHKKYTTN